MYIFIGLGNPESKYTGTRHNIGRETLIAAQKKFGLPAFAPSQKLTALLTDGKIAKKRMVFALPQTFVNKSGLAAAPALRLFKAKPKELILIHDDVDLLLGATKLSFGRNSGGHKGVESVMRAIKTKNFWRMRIGVQKKRRVPGEDLVLQKFRGDEQTVAKKIVKKNLAAIETIATASPERTMNEYNA
ncbi:MAG: aminoacyl-tRNA hydrolase [Patescibacteria group bacterium]